MLRQILVTYISAEFDSACPYMNCCTECPLVAAVQVQEKGESSLFTKGGIKKQLK